MNFSPLTARCGPSQPLKRAAGTNRALVAGTFRVIAYFSEGIIYEPVCPSRRLTAFRVVVRSSVPRIQKLKNAFPEALAAHDDY
jgi:hypothetical protein